MNGVIWFWPGVILALPLALLVARPVARALRTRPWLGWLLAYSVAVILVATLTPIHRRPGADLAALRTCDLSRLWFAAPSDLTRLNDISLNVALFVPLGLAIAWLPASPRKVAVAVAAVCAPFAIEALQYALPILSRGCQSGDVIDNLTGLAVGLAVGSIVGWLASRVVARRT
jgi:hypothetical protein